MWNGTAWGDFFAAVTALQNLTLLGVGTTADTTNPLSAKLNNTLFVAKTVAEGGDGNLRYKLSKESAAKTLSFLFQDNYSGRAEIGLTGDDDFHFKVSPDGSTWLDALKLDKSSGAATLAASAAAAAFIPSGASAPSNGIYLPGANTVGIAANSTQIWTGTASTIAVKPTTAATSSTTGALTVGGGLGVAGAIYGGSGIYAAADIYFNGNGRLGMGPGGSDTNFVAGYYANGSNVSGTYNVAIGKQSLGTNTAGSYNVAIGVLALLQATGGYNFGLGWQAGYDVTSGQDNIFIGANTGRGIATGSHNTVIGGGVSGLAAGLNNNIIIATNGSIVAQFDGTKWTFAGSGNSLTAAAFIPAGSTVPANGIYLPAANSLGWATNTTARGKIDANGNFILGTAALATNATNGFVYIPSCAGTPTGTPTAVTGMVPIVYDSTNHKLYVYDGGWKGGTVPGAWS